MQLTKKIQMMTQSSNRNPKIMGQSLTVIKWRNHWLRSQ